MTKPLQNTVVVVGAGRSGTTMMREALSSHKDLASCTYEMNYLWHYGNNVNHDMLNPSEHFKDANGNHIREKLGEILLESGKDRLVEKTVANIMRLAYVHAVLPDARIIHIIRDGRAVSASAMLRWRAKPEASYFLSKAKTIPIASLPRVAFRYVSSALKGKVRKRDYNQSWGPRWPGIDEDVAQLSLAELCGKQWAQSVQAGLDQKTQIPSEQYMEVRYEDVVSKPEELFLKIAEFVDIDPNEASFHNHITTQIHAKGLDKWKQTLSDTEINAIYKGAGPLLGELGYT